MPRKKFKKSHEYSISEIDQCNATSDYPESRLCVLPYEVLQIIFSYLSPSDFLTISELRIKRLKEVICSFRCADFSSCHKALPEDVTAFFNRSVRHIREINFNNLFFVESSLLEGCIVLCKNLTVLSVVDCKLSISNIYQIFKYCSKLEELSWSVNAKFNLDYPEVIKNKQTASKVKKLYFHVRDTPLPFQIIINVINACPNADDIVLNFSPHSMTSFLPEVSRLSFVGKIDHVGRRIDDFMANLEKKRLLKIVTYSDLMKTDVDITSKQRSLMAIQIQNSGLFQMEVDLATFFNFNMPGFLQLRTEEQEDLDALISLPDDSVTTLSLLVTTESKLLLQHMEKLKSVTRKSLRHLRVHYFGNHYLLDEDTGEVQLQNITFICDLLPSIISNSCNITVLNLSELHHCSHFPFSALYCLKRLKLLSLSACILKKPTKWDEFDFKDRVKEFNGIISNCKYVEKFSMYGCLACCKGPPDRGLTAICQWKWLTSLTLSEVPTLRTCHFLLGVVKSCPYFKRLELINVGNLSVCCYTLNVLQVLKKAKNLGFLKINQTGFVATNEHFWKAVRYAFNLEGICLGTLQDNYVSSNMIINNIKKLKYLHSFHVTTKGAYDDLSERIKKMMDENNIQHQDIYVKNTRIAYENKYVLCKLSHIPTF